MCTINLGIATLYIILLSAHEEFLRTQFTGGKLVVHMHLHTQPIGHHECVKFSYFKEKCSVYGGGRVGVQRTLGGYTKILCN